jgi:hypothetical protein
MSKNWKESNVIEEKSVKMYAVGTEGEPIDIQDDRMRDNSALPCVPALYDLEKSAKTACDYYTDLDQVEAGIDAPYEVWEVEVVFKRKLYTATLEL